MVTSYLDILQLVKKNKCKLQQFGILRVGVFGSFVRDEQKAISDVDLIVEFLKSKKTYRNFIGAADFVEGLFERKVDLVTPESLSPYIAPHIKKDIKYIQIV